ncbi:MFS transporter [Streptacidiphilus sp. N1-3]|uniref:MFS transporter n=1 Tax=Streptacidiphilus alkalitolerans TaxID=3342712 RepID=A0ABV6WYI5_9ACTN
MSAPTASTAPTAAAATAAGPVTADTAPAAPAARGLRALTAYRIVSRAYFHLPVMFVFLFRGHLPVLGIESLMALYGLTVAVAPLLLRRPTRKLSLRGQLLVGESVKVTGLLCLALGPNLPTALAGQILSGAGFALTAGTDSALLSTLTRGGDFARREAVTQGWMFAGSFAAGTCGALAFAHGQRLPFALSGLAAIAALGCLAALRTDPPAPAPAPAPAPVPTPAAAPAAATAVPDKPVAATSAPVPSAARFWQWYYALNRAFLLAPYVGFIPYLLVSRLHLGLSWFGAVLGLYTLSGFAAARLSPRLMKRISDPRRLAFVPAVLTAGGLALLAGPNLGFALVAIIALGLAGGFIRPTAMANLEPHLQALDPAGRRAMTGRMEQHQAIWSAVLLVAGGLLLPVVSLPQLFLALAGVNLLVQGVVLAGSRRADRTTTA